MEPSDALSIAKRAHHSLKGRKVGILVGDAPDEARLEALSAAIAEAGAKAVLIHKQRGRAEEQLAGQPSVFFDAVALALSAEDSEALSRYKPAIDFVSDAFAHSKAIGADETADALLEAAGVTRDAGVVPLLDAAGFVAAASRRYYDREETLW